MKKIKTEADPKGDISDINKINGLIIELNNKEVNQRIDSYIKNKKIDNEA